MARYQVIFAYDGTCFKGSQRQAKSRTVQAELERALRRLGWSGQSILMAGRTDKGVHASGQVAAFDLDWRDTSEAFCHALNSHLSSDIAIRSVTNVPADFHPRFDATSRRYRYRLFCQPVRDPLRERFAWRVWPLLDGDILISPPQALLGTHDFAAFGSPPRRGGSTQRTIMQAFWQAQGDEWLFEVQADAFLYRMVRRLVYLQVAAGQGRLPVDAIAKALVSRIDLSAGIAPASGLTLMEVTYPHIAGLEQPG